MDQPQHLSEEEWLSSIHVTGRSTGEIADNTKDAREQYRAFQHPVSEQEGRHYAPIQTEIDGAKMVASILEAYAQGTDVLERAFVSDELAAVKYILANGQVFYIHVSFDEPSCTFRGLDERDYTY